MVLESFISVNEHDGYLFAVGFFKVRIRFDVDHTKRKRETQADALDDLLRYVAKVAAWTGIYLNASGF